MKLTRDDWMVIERALQDRIAALPGGPLCAKEAEHCERLRKAIEPLIALPKMQEAA